MIDELLPNFDFSEKQEIDVSASSENVFSAIKQIDLCESTMIYWLLKMRGASIKTLNLRDLEEGNFKTLSEIPNQTLILGAINEFGTKAKALADLTKEDFRSFDKEKFVKTLWSFQLKEINGKVRVTNETRIKCTDGDSLVKLKNYWGMIKPFVNKFGDEALKLTKKRAERR